MESGKNVLDVESVGKRSDELDHIFESSDEFYDFQCSTCHEEGKNVNAEMYCVDCDHFLCKTCLKQHNKFGVMKTHQIVRNSDGTGRDQLCEGYSVDLPSQRCDTHHGKLLDMFCRDHNAVCCGACASLYHRVCANLRYLPHIVKTIDVSQDAKSILQEIVDLESRFKEQAKEKQQHGADLKKEKVKVTEDIKENCSKIVDHFRILESSLLSRLNDKVDIFQDGIQAKLLQTDEVISSLKKERTLLTKYLADGNIASLFVQMKLAEKCRIESGCAFKQLKTPYTPNFEFSVNYRADDVNKIKSLGEIHENKTIKLVSLNGDFDVKATKEKSVCDITDIIMHVDGTLLIADFVNKSLKRLNCQYQVIDHVCLPGQPNAVCFVSGSSVAVALTDIKVVQFVSLWKKMSLTSSFSVVNTCRGVAHKAGFMYVTCGGNHKYDEGKGILCIYTYSGEMLKTFDVDFSLPKHILKHKDGDRLYVVDTQKCLVILTTEGTMLQRRIFRDIDNLKGICSGPGNQHFLCGFNSNSIILISANAYQLSRLNVDGIRKPQALCFDENKSQLIVAMENTNHIKILDLTFE